MNVNPYQLVAPRHKVSPPGKSFSKSEKADSANPPEIHEAWFQNYDEEWAMFLAESSLKKTRPGLGNCNPETLPRVWNCPPE